MENVTMEAAKTMGHEMMLISKYLNQNGSKTNNIADWMNKFYKDPSACMNALRKLEYEKLGPQSRILVSEEQHMEFMRYQAERIKNPDETSHIKDIVQKWKEKELSVKEFCLA